MEIRWSPLAAEDLERIFQRIAKDNPTAARGVVKTIYDGCAALKEFPHRGRPSRINGRRELVFTPYIVVYQVKENSVEISRIYHGAQDWP
ncbi:MAG: type II toxin-antitoxin system RelE/ParE family toxin [Candidatus Sulfotelmatobacter sp.]